MCDGLVVRKTFFFIGMLFRFFKQCLRCSINIHAFSKRRIYLTKVLFEIPNKDNENQSKNFKLKNIGVSKNESMFESNILDSSIAFVPISSIKQYLLRHEIIFSEGHSCISVKCPICKNEESLMYINKVSGFFICSDCQKSGNWNLLELFLSNPKHHLVDLPLDQTMDYGKRCWESVKDNLQPVNESVFDFPHFKDWKRLHLENLKELGVRLCPKEKTVYFPLTHGNNVVGFKKLNSDLTEETFPDKSGKGIIVFKRKYDTAVIVANVKDFLTLLTYPLECDVICLPNGQQSLPQDILPLFEPYKKLILWFDNDVVSWGNVKMFAKKLSESRCYFIRPLEDQPAAHESMMFGYDIASIIANAQCISHSSIVTFATLREDVLAEICNADKVSGVKWERFPVLNSLLKGHRRGELTILTGPTGSGKTTLMSEYSLDLAMNKVTTLWGSFEIRNQRLAKTMLTQMFLAPLEKNINKFNEWADKFERLPVYFMTFHGQQPLDVVMEAVEHATYVHDVAHVIIDNVQFMLGLSSSESGFLDRFYRQDALIGRFRNFATTHNCHVTLVIHPRKEREAEELTANSIFGGAKAAQEADNILIIQHRKSHTSLRIKKFLQVAKNRFSGDLGIMPLEFDKESLSFRSKKG